MKLSKRERVLILVLIIVSLIYAGSKLMSSKNIFDLETLKSESSQKNDIYNTMSNNILLKSKYEEKLLTLNNEIYNLNVISDITQEKAIVFLNNYFSKFNIDANNISFTDEVVIPIYPQVAQGEEKIKSSLEILMDSINGNKTTNQETGLVEESSNDNEVENGDNQEEQTPLLTVRSISANVVFESTYDNMLKFIDAIQNNIVDISITNINTVISDSGSLQGTMTLNFYEVPKPEGFIENNDEWIWKELMKSGKNNPFSSDGVATVFNSSSNKYDFYISVKPESSDLPTIIVGRAQDDNRTTYLYEDSNKIEDVNLQFKAENNKYYYKYNTLNNLYPSDGSWQEFSPVSNGNVYIKVYSSSRNSKTDSAGVNISINNTSGLKIRFEVEDDDSSSPRVYFRDPKSVVVTRK